MDPTADVLHLWVPASEADAAVGRLWAAGVAAIEERRAPDGLVELVTWSAAEDFWAEVVPTLVWRYERRTVDVGAAIDAWRPHARTSRIAGVDVRPVWIDPGGTAGDVPVIELEPGRAWGHGAHPTTVLAGELVAAELDARSGRGERPTVLDVGCGSGVLSLLAAHRGARVTAVDVDAEARRATSENVARNGLEANVRVHRDEHLDGLGPYDVVVANIGLGVIADLAPGLIAASAPAGTVVLSGLLDDQVDAAVAALGAVGGHGILDPVSRLDDAPWAAVALRRI